jgi:hypothetical protein
MQRRLWLTVAMAAWSTALALGGLCQTQAPPPVPVPPVAPGPPAPAALVVPVPKSATEACTNGTVVHIIPREAIERCVGGTRATPTPAPAPVATWVVPGYPALGLRLELWPDLRPPGEPFRIRPFGSLLRGQVPPPVPPGGLKLRLGRPRPPLVDIQITPQAAP